MDKYETDYKDVCGGLLQSVFPSVHTNEWVVMWLCLTLE